MLGGRGGYGTVNATNPGGGRPGALTHLAANSQVMPNKEQSRGLGHVVHPRDGDHAPRTAEFGPDFTSNGDNNLENLKGRADGHMGKSV